MENFINIYIYFSTENIENLPYLHIFLYIRVANYILTKVNKSEVFFNISHSEV